MNIIYDIRLLKDRIYVYIYIYIYIYTNDSFKIMYHILYTFFFLKPNAKSVLNL